MAAVTHEGSHSSVTHGIESPCTEAACQPAHTLVACLLPSPDLHMRSSPHLPLCINPPPAVRLLGRVPQYCLENEEVPCTLTPVAFLRVRTPLPRTPSVPKMLHLLLI